MAASTLRRRMAPLVAVPLLIAATLAASPASADDSDVVEQYVTENWTAVTAAPGSAQHDAQVLAQEDFWADAPWDEYFASQGLPEGIEVSTGTTRGDDGTLTAWTSYVVPEGFDAPAPIEDSVAASSRSSVGILAAACKQNVWITDETCVNNYVGPSAASGTWKNYSGAGGQTAKFRLRVGTTNAACTTDSTVVTGNLRTVAPGATYVLTYTTAVNGYFTTSGWDSGLGVRFFRACVGVV